MISKGGTSQYHGDVFEFLRNSAFNARNFFDGPKIPHLEKNNFGASHPGFVSSCRRHGNGVSHRGPKVGHAPGQ